MNPLTPIPTTPIIYPDGVDRISVQHCSPLGLKEEIDKAIAKYGEDKVRFKVGSEYEAWDHEPTVFCRLECYRPMNEKEKERYRIKVSKETSDRETFERAQYLALKAKFESKPGETK